MDSRRFSTQETPIPEDREEMSTSYEDDYIGQEAVIEALDKGLVVYSSNYNGISHLWKEGSQYRGILLQYNAITDDKTFDAIGDAVDWFEETSGATTE